MKYYVKKKKLLRYEICLELKTLRMKSQITLQEISKRLNMDTSKVNKLENGIGVLSYDFIKQYLNALNINIEHYKKFKDLKDNLLI
jgi:transcriptional regulator with XRE-family HTH domain